MVMRLSASRFRLAARAGEGGVYTQGGQNFYGTFTGLINNQAISQNYHNLLAVRLCLCLGDLATKLGQLELQLTAGFRGTPRRDLTFLVSYTYAHSLDDRLCQI